MHAASRRQTPSPVLTHTPSPHLEEVKPREDLERAYTPEPEETHMLTFFKKDLPKSLILIASIIGLEICLYFASINHYFGLGR